MKKEAPSKLKFRQLCRYLDLEDWQAIGLLESLWLATEREAERGDIGRKTNEEIAMSIGYRSNEDDLIAALLKARWLDPHPDPAIRLVVHDWADHCPDYIHARVARARTYFADGKPPKLVKLSKAETTACEAFYHLGQVVVSSPEPMSPELPFSDTSTEDLGCQTAESGSRNGSNGSRRQPERLKRQPKPPNGTPTQPNQTQPNQTKPIPPPIHSVVGGTGDGSDDPPGGGGGKPERKPDSPSEPGRPAGPIDIRDLAASRGMNGRAKRTPADLAALDELRNCLRLLQPDEAAIMRLVDDCRRIDPACTLDEISQACYIRGRQTSGFQGIKNPIGLLLETVPGWFADGGNTGIREYRQQKRQATA